MLRISLLAVFAVLVPGQTIPAGESQDLAVAARNPYQLARFIDSRSGFDWDVMWRALGSEPLFIRPCGEFAKCWTELITVLNPDQVILAIQGNSTPADVFLRFVQENPGTWHFEGAHEADIRNHPRRHEVDRSTGKPFLRISGQGIYGSGVDSEFENWFDLTQPGFEPVFSFPVQGYQHRLDLGIGREIHSTIIANRNEIDVTLQVNFWGEERLLGLRLFQAVFVRGAGAKDFKIRDASGLLGRFKISLRPRNLWVSLAGMPALKCTAALVDSGFSDAAIL